MIRVTIETDNCMGKHKWEFESMMGAFMFGDAATVKMLRYSDKVTIDGKIVKSKHSGFERAMTIEEFLQLG
jgi:hypothetical protein